MILRRIAAAFRKQDWFTVFVETMIVVMGVFLGLQVNNWNEARTDRALEREYLVRLYDDMNGSLQDYSENDGWDLTRIETQEFVLSALRTGELADEDRERFARGLVFVGSHNPIRRRWGTVEELKSTGNLAVIRDLELRALIAATDADYVRADRVVSESIQQVLLLREPILRRFDPIAYGFQTDDPVKANFDFEALAADQEFINLIAHVQLNSRQAVAFNDGHMQKISALRDKLELVLKIEPEEEPAP